MKKAFTLIELLVVIAIIAILAAILFPVFAQAKAAAKQTACLLNTKQFATAFTLYSGDNDDVYCGSLLTIDNWKGGGYNLPNGFMDPAAEPNWGAQLFPYVKAMPMYVCPMAIKAAFTETWGPGLNYNPSPGAANSSYHFNGALAFKSQTQAQDPANLILIRDATYAEKTAVSRPGNPSSTGSTNFCYNVDDSDLGANHKGGGNNAFADGHAKFGKRQALTYAQLGLTRDTCTDWFCNMYYTDVASGGDYYPATGRHQAWVPGPPENVHLPAAGGGADNWTTRTCNL